MEAWLESPVDYPTRGAGDMEAAKSEANDPDAWHAGRTPVKLKQQQEAAGEYF